MAERSGTAAPVLGVRDVRAAAEYYRDVLGFRIVDIVRGAGEEPGGVYGFVELRGAEIHLQIRRGDLPARRRESIETDVYFHLDEVDDLHRDLVRRGATVTQPPRDAPYGMREIRVEDLHGHRLTFGAPVRARDAR